MKWPTKLALFFVLMIFGLSLAYYYSKHWRGADANRLRSLATWGLGDYLAKTYPQSATLIVANPFSQLSEMSKDVINQEQSGVEGLKSGFGRSITEVTVVYPALKDGALENPESFVTNPDVTTPLSFLLETNSFDELEKAYPGHDVWISLIGLPVQLNLVGPWNRPGPPRFAMLLPDLKLIGSKELLRELVVSEKLVAFVLTKPGVLFETEELGGDLQEEFDRRYLLVTRDNIDEVLDTHPGLFIPVR